MTGCQRVLEGSAVLVAAVLLVGRFPDLPAQASVSEDAERPLIHTTGATLPRESSSTAQVHTWPEGNRLYRLIGVQDLGAIVAYDATSLTEVARASLSPLAYREPGEGLEATVAVDRAGERLFVPYRISGPTATLFDPNAYLKWAQGAAGGTVCAAVPTLVALPPCVGGMHVLDAKTLQPVRPPIPLRTLSVDGGAFTGTWRASGFAPSRGDGDPGKVLMLVEERTHNSVPGLTPPARTLQGIYYAVQLDPESGNQDWAVRVDACRSSREPFDGEEPYARRLPHAAAIFRTPSLEDPAVWVGCHGHAQQAVAVRIPLDSNGDPAELPVRTGAPGSAAEGIGQDSDLTAPGDVGGQSRAVDAFFGPEKALEVVADPDSQRMLFRVLESGAEVWWVFDGRRGAFMGTIGIGPFNSAAQESSSGLDPDTGRFYVAWQPKDESSGKLFVADVRRSPVAQALVFDLGLPKIAPRGTVAVVPMPGEGGGRRLFVKVTGAASEFVTIEDRLPVSVDPELEFGAGRSLDLDEVAGVTDVALDGAARGYGARVLMVGGLDAVARGPRLDPITAVREQWQRPTLTNNVLAKLPFAHEPVSECSKTNREVILGLVGPSGPAVVDGSGSRGGAVPVVVDQALRADMEAPVSRCSPLEWASLWGTALFGRAPMEEPQLPWPFGENPAECVSAAEETAESVGDPVVGAFAAAVRCAGDAEEASGYSYARGTTLGDLSVAEAMSSFRIYRDPGRGIVSVVESVARGVLIPGLLRIDTVRGRAESWANGRRQPVAAADRAAGYDPNCDSERTAGTCFRRHMFGVWTPGYSCGPCGDERAFVDGMSRGMGGYGSVKLRDPDPVLAQGAESGAIAAIQKPERERFGDLALNDDLLQTILPTLEIIRQAPPQATAPDTSKLPQYHRGRQIYQLAGVEVSSSYGISCLLVYDEAANTCGAPAEPPGSLTVNLVDEAGAPLAGGVFEVRADADADGVVGLADALVAEGACVTAADGVGTCRFGNLAPGGYVVSQVSAPAGYSRIGEPFTVELAAGEARTATFTNVSSVSVIQVSVIDEADGPVAGAVFAVFPDPDADGKVAADAQPAATCTTDTSGTCAMRVPAGSYVLVQTAAPAGLEPIEPVAFALNSGGQTAAVTAVNYPLGISAAEPAAAPVPVYADPAPAPVVQTVDDYRPLPPLDGPAAPEVGLADAVGGAIVRVAVAPGDAMRLLARDPQQAAAFTAVIALLALAVMAVRRRRHATTLIHPMT